MTDDRPIGVFDSGAGGISVLRKMMDQMPHERFAYFGDSLNTPYGNRTTEWIRHRSDCIVRFLHDDLGAKAIVIACNTATAAAADWLREANPDVPIFGIEPALKPAATATPGGTVLVMATEKTLRLDRYRLLVDRWGTGAAVVSIPCPGLADAIEEGQAGTEEMQAMVDGFIGGWRGHADAVVLGCTHYPFVIDEIRNALGEDVMIYDGAEGTARNVRVTMLSRGMMAGDSTWDGNEQASRLLIGTGPNKWREQTPDTIIPNAWNMPDDRVLLMTSGTVRHIVQFEALLEARGARHIGRSSSSRSSQSRPMPSPLPRHELYHDVTAAIISMNPATHDRNTTTSASHRVRYGTTTR